VYTERQLISHLTWVDANALEPSRQSDASILFGKRFHRFCTHSVQVCLGSALALSKRNEADLHTYVERCSNAPQHSE
jgi:hypothetical protein